MVQGERLVSAMFMQPQAVTNGATATARMDTWLGPVSQPQARYVDVDVAFASQVNTNAVSPTVQLLESDDTVVTNFATISPIVNPTLTAPGFVRFCIDMRARKRWLRLTVGIPTATNDNQVVSATARVRRQLEPASIVDLGDSNSTAVIVN